MNVMINIFINFQTCLVFKYLDRYFDAYPSKKNTKKDDEEAPNPKRIF